MVRERRDKWTVFPMLSGSEKPSEMNVASRRFSVALPWSFVRSQSWRTDQNVKSHTAELPGHFVPNPFIGSSHQAGDSSAALRVPSLRWRRSDGTRAPSPPRSRARASPAQATVVVEGLRHGADADRGGCCRRRASSVERALRIGSIASAGAPLPAVVDRSDMRRPHFTAPLRKPET